MRLNLKNPRHAALAASMAALAVLLLAACGSSKGTTATSAGASTSTTAKRSVPTTANVPPPPKSRGQFAVRIAALRKCLKKNGIPLPSPKSATGLLGLQPPPGVSRAQYEAALKKCGGSKFHPLKGSGTLSGVPQLRQALVKFAACMRANGVKVPAPNTSGKGPVFNTAGVNTSSPQFRAAMTKCRPQLTKAYPRFG